MLRDTARYAFGLVFTRIMPLNDDLTIPTTIRILGGSGPFDYSGEALPAAIPLITKIDNGAAETVNVDLSGVVDITAVTVTELYTAINLASPTDITASEDGTTSRIKFAYDATEDPGYVQVYGACALVAMVGQGLGAKFVKSDTWTSQSDTPILKDEETFTTTDAAGIDTEVLSDGYRKGLTATIVDTAEDWELKQMLEGGHYDDGNVSGIIDYDTPTSEDSKVYFFMESFYTQYTKGTNKVADLVGYVKLLIRTAKGSVGDSSHERDFGDGNYTITATSYKDENGVLYGDANSRQLTKTEYADLDVYDV